METITITKRTIKGNLTYNKRFNGYDTGFYGKRISKKEYEESKARNKAIYTDTYKFLNITERITYNN